MADSVSFSLALTIREIGKHFKDGLLRGAPERGPSQVKRIIEHALVETHATQLLDGPSLDSALDKAFEQARGTE